MATANDLRAQARTVLIPLAKIRHFACCLFHVEAPGMHLPFPMGPAESGNREVFKRLLPTHFALTVFPRCLRVISRYDNPFAVCLIYLRPSLEEQLQSEKSRSNVSSVLETASPEASGY